MSFIGFQQYAFAELSDINFFQYLHAKIEIPSSVVAGKQFTIGFVIQNQGASEVDNITILTHAESDIISLSGNGFTIPRLASDGSYATTMNFQVLPNATLGTQYVNMNFTSMIKDSLLDNNNSTSFYNNAFTIQITEKPKLDIQIIVPESIFANAEFPFQATITGQGTGLHNATVKIVYPPDLIFRGELEQAFSEVAQNVPITMTARLITNNTQVDIEHHIPFQVIVDYTDNSGEKKEQSATTSIVLRPRSMFELGTEGGFWIGNTYFSPTIDALGTIVTIGVPLSIFLYNRRMKKKSVTVAPAGH
ncbi:MAG: hypothetical protein ACREAD_04215 [Nitrosopumilaceae archaeon]